MSAGNSVLKLIIFFGIFHIKWCGHIHITTWSYMQGFNLWCIYHGVIMDYTGRCEGAKAAPAVAQRPSS